MRESAYGQDITAIIGFTPWMTDNPMHRRRFIKMMANLAKAAFLVNVAPVACAVSSTGPGRGNAPAHFKPLDGLTLRAMAMQKLHHGTNGRFVNPLGDTRHRRRFGRVLYWKLFSENAYKLQLFI